MLDELDAKLEGPVLAVGMVAALVLVGGFFFAPLFKHKPGSQTTAAIAAKTPGGNSCSPSPADSDEVWRQRMHQMTDAAINANYEAKVAATQAAMQAEERKFQSDMNQGNPFIPRAVEVDGKLYQVIK